MGDCGESGPVYVSLCGCAMLMQILNRNQFDYTLTLMLRNFRESKVDWLAPKHSQGPEDEM